MRQLKRFLQFLVVSVILVVAMFYFFQEKLIFYSSEIAQNYVFRFESNFEELFLTAEDGAVLNGLHFKQEKSNGIILYCHGNAGEIDSWGKWAEELSNRYQHDVVIWDYRGYGKSTGKRRQNLMLDDGHLFYDYCKNYFPEEQIAVFGRSLGGFFATHITKKTNPERLVLESTPTSLLEVAREAYPFIPSNWLLKFRFQNVENIEQISTPTYLIHGTEDDLIPFEHGRRLFELSKAEKKQFFPIEGGKHNNLSNFEVAFFSALDEIFVR